MHLPTVLSKARHSTVIRWWLNVLLPWTIPFNGPHGFNVRPMPEGGIEVGVPYWRVNRNHIRGIHACAIATAAEMCSGLSVLELLDPQKYRLIMRKITMEYFFQAKQAAMATCKPSAAEIKDGVLDPLGSQDAVDYTSTVLVHDKAGNHLATGTVVWQVKSWAKVRTKV